MGDIDDDDFETFQQAHYRELAFFKAYSRFAEKAAELEAIGPPPTVNEDGAVGRLRYHEYHVPTRDEFDATVTMMQAKNLITAEEADTERAARGADPSAETVQRFKALAAGRRSR